MAWIQLFPTGNKLMSQSVTQMQDNNLALQTYAATDHFFNTGAPTEGHHKFMHMQNQGVVPPIVLDTVICSVAVAGHSQPFFRNAGGAKEITMNQYGTVIAGGAGVHNLPTFAGTPRCQGILMISDHANYSNSGFAFVSWNGTVHTRQIVVHGTITAVASATPFATFTTTAAGTFEWTFIRIEAF